MKTTEHDRRADELLAVRCQLGEPAAFDDLVARWHRPVWTYVRRVIGQDEPAREIVQEVWIRVIRGIARLRDGARLRAWLFGIARRTMMDALREQYARASGVDVDPDEIAADASTEDLQADLDELERALDHLPLAEREVLTLFYLEDLSLADVAEALKVPVGTVKSRLFRARRMLRSHMAARGIHR